MDVTRVVPRAGFVVAVSMVLALATASAASAQSTVGKNAGGNGIVYTDPGSNVDRIELSWLNNTSTDTFEHAITSVAGGTPPVSAGTGCGGGPPSFFCGSTMASLVATLGGGDDALDLRPASTPVMRSRRRSPADRATTRSRAAARPTTSAADPATTGSSASRTATSSVARTGRTRST